MCGSPQGSIYAVFVFSIYINEMPDIIDNFFLLYADDTKIIGNWFDLSSIQTDINNVITWAAENRIDFNFDKSEQISFQKSNKRYPLSDLSSINGEQIASKDTLEDLSVWCNSKCHGYTT